MIKAIRLFNVSCILTITFCCSSTFSEKNFDSEMKNIDFNNIAWFKLIKSEIVDFKIDLSGEYVFFLTEDKFLYRTNISNLQNFDKIKLTKGGKILIGIETIGLMDYFSEDSSVFFSEFNIDLIKVHDETFKFGRRTHLGDIQYSFFRRDDSSYYMANDYNKVDIFTGNSVLYDKINLIDMDNGNQFIIDYDSCTTIKLKGEIVLDLSNYKYLKCKNMSPIKIYNNTIYLRQNGVEYVKEIKANVDTFKISTDKIYPIDNFTKKGTYLFENNILHWNQLNNLY